MLKFIKHLSVILSLLLVHIARSQDIQKQNDIMTKKVINWLNKNEPDSIYRYFDATMKNALSKEVFIQSVNTQLALLMPVEATTFHSFASPVSFYRLKVKGDSLHFQIATNNEGLISGLFLKPLNIAQKARPTSAISKTIDSIAQLAYGYLNNKDADALYSLQGKKFREKISDEKFKALFASQIFPMLPLTTYEYIKTTDSTSKYKAALAAGINLQILFTLDDERKLAGFVLQPYEEEKLIQQIKWHDNALATALDSAVHKAVIDKMSKTHVHGLSLAVLQGLKVFYYNYGIAKPATDQHPLNKTLYEIGSITKTFTAFILADAVIKKKVQLSDAITKYLPAELAANTSLQAITLEQLANHTSGLPRMPDNISATMKDPSDPYGEYRKEDLYAFIKNYSSGNPTGKNYAYSNLGFGLLGAIMENVYGKSYEDLCKELIFKPSRMNDAYVANISDSSMVASGFNEEGIRVPYWNFKIMQAAGSAKSNTEDMIKYALQFTQKQNRTNKFTPVAELLMTPTFNNNGTKLSLAWHMGSLKDTIDFMEHSGGTYGFRSNIMIVPDKQIAIAGLVNSATEGMIENINRTVLSFIAKP
ncbi:serine hydrolase domain-containing protein [Polluticaenibacter yanchengensis]|uniref:Serine hydrolase n=1 Tax=Polluticaenibacter yanchengensis TaxID=3014562 RepID=A0ABT4UM91_9BACT|nr:serine hydrolase [Chitinophagaceae bacterium LY-5]